MMIKFLNNKKNSTQIDLSQLKIPYPMKSKYDMVIPANLFQTWHTTKLPPLMYNAVAKIRKLNPRFNYKIFDDNDCREFIKNNFKHDVLNAYDNLIPGAYKADLWRYCILYKCGGIYLDIKYEPLNGFRFINLLEKEHLVADLDNVCIYNALMVCKAGNEILLKVINRIVENVQTKFYGECYLSPTGPRLLSNFVSTNDDIVDLKHSQLDSNYKLLSYNNIPILKSYYGHLSERDNFSVKEHYASLWNKRQIYL